MVFDWLLVWQNKSLILLLEIFQRSIRFGDFSSSSMYYPTVLFIYAPPMKYWVTIDLKFPLLALTQIVSGEINQKDMIFEALVSKQG